MTSFAIIAGRRIVVDTLAEHAAQALAGRAMALWSVDQDPDDCDDLYLIGSEVVVECYAPGHEYITDRDYTRAAVEVTPQIVSRARALLEERLAS